jgi:O-antigen/teichoic acid export membrane protein
VNLNTNIKRNALFLFVARIANPAATVAVGLYIAKTVGVETFGQFSFILSYCFLFAVVFSLGLATMVSRDTAKAPEQRAEYFTNTSAIGLVSGTVGLVLMLLGSRFFQLSSGSRDALAIFSFSILPSILIFIWESLLVTFEKNPYIVAVQTIEAVAKIVGSYILLYKGYGLTSLMTLFLAGRFLSAGLYYLVLKMVFKPLIAPLELPFIKKTLALVPTFAGLYIFSVLLSKTDLLMLALLKDFKDVGIYAAAYKLLEISFLLPTCIVTVLFPVLARYAQNSSKKFVYLSHSAIFYSMALFLPIVIGCILFADKIIFTVYSEDFFDSVLPFQILIITLAFYMMDQIFAHCLVAGGLQNLNLKALVRATAMNIVLNLILIPKYSALGAGIATLLSMATLTLTHLYFIRKHLFRFNVTIIMVALLAAALCYVPVPMLPRLPLLIMFPVASMIYLLLFLWFKGRAPRGFGGGIMPHEA